MQLRIDNLSRALTGQPVLRGVNLTLPEGHIGCLLGSSGCGKTTLLRCIAGFESIDTGSIYLNDEVVASSNTHVAPHARGVGMVFQDHALFPHLTVAQNTAFGLHQWTRGDASHRVEEVLTLVGLQAHAERFPHQLSGGQQQRAALARALATKPKLLLLDEPFASLDRELRYRLVQEVSAILRSSQTTALWVTHDAREALQAADFVGVMRSGNIVQWDTPSDLYARPSSPEVASALGDCTLLPGVMRSDEIAMTALGSIAVDSHVPLSTGQNVAVLARPEQVALRSPDDITHEADAGGASADNSSGQPVVRAIVRDVWFHGLSTLCIVGLDDGTEVKVATRVSPDLVRGALVGIAFNTRKTVAFIN